MILEDFPEGLWNILQDHVQQWRGGAVGLGIAPTAATFMIIGSFPAAGLGPL